MNSRYSRSIHPSPAPGKFRFYHTILMPVNKIYLIVTSLIIWSVIRNRIKFNDFIPFPEKTDSSVWKTACRSVLYPLSKSASILSFCLLK